MTGIELVLASPWPVNVLRPQSEPPARRGSRPARPARSSTRSRAPTPMRPSAAASRERRHDTIVVVGATTLSTPDNGSNGLPVITESLVITSPDPAANSSISRDRASAPRTSACSRSAHAARGPDGDAAPAEPGERPGPGLVHPRRHSGGGRRRLHPAAQRLAHDRRQRHRGVHRGRDRQRERAAGGGLGRGASPPPPAA